MNHHKLKKWFVFGSLAFLTILLVVIAYWTFYPYKVITFASNSNDIATPVIKQGGTGSYKVKYCKYIDPPTTTERYFMDTIIYQVDTGVGKLPLGCHTYFASFLVPKNLPTGEYHLKTIAHYKVNPIKTIDITRETTKFLVIE